MSGPGPIKRIIWALDAFQESPEASELQSRCADTLRALTNGLAVEIEPVYVVPPQNMNAPFELLYPPLGFYGGEAEAALHRKLEGLRLPGLLPSKVIDKPALTTTGSIKALVEYARDTGTDLIVLATHGRSGVSRLFLGSFAETLLLHSDVPALTVGRCPEPVTSFSRILFPADFSSASEAVFPWVLELARQFKATVFIYHLIRGSAPLDSAFFVEGAKQAGVAAELELEVSQLSESDAILAAADRKGANLIAMAARRGPVSSFFAGSTTRQVVRNARCPVWILHPAAVAHERNAA